jgi:hypothetical protein
MVPMGQSEKLLILSEFAFYLLVVGASIIAILRSKGVHR